MENENKQPQGWRSVQITPEMPIALAVDFLNVLNQRITTIEDTIQIPYGDKQELKSLTEIYAIQAEEQKKLAEEKAKEEKPEDK